MIPEFEKVCNMIKELNTFEGKIDEELNYDQRLKVKQIYIIPTLRIHFKNIKTTEG